MATPTPAAAQFLHLKISRDGALKIGTCGHCVIQEPGRPDRAWNPDGDRELDFDRDTLIQHLRDLGITVQITQEYVCP
jgi:hypothetical protein